MYIGRQWLFLLAGVVIGACIFFLFFFFVFSKENANVPPKELVQENSKYPHIRPLILPWDQELNKTQELLPFRSVIDASIEKLIQEKKAENIAYYFRDLNNGPYFGINIDESFSLASLLKVPVLMSYYRWAEQDPSILRKTLFFEKSKVNRVDENPLTKPKKLLQPGKNYVVENLIEKMITESDNDSFQLLVDNIDVGLLADPYSLTETEIESKDQEYMGSLRRYSTFIRAIYNASYLSRPYSEKAMLLLTKSEFEGGIVAGLPKGFEVAHKFGVRETEDMNQLHDCGVVYYPHNPYLICIMTKGKDLYQLSDVIKQLSLLTYKEVYGQLKKR
ncbi:MAG: serine hydrolase [Candidatus Levybacteria bacterium]|nr:serine hydrolase [Candidatus Levybacteria bacterium]MBP9814940.1 serine hydrolase [Candidatus Levybacteria bacterium]